MGIHLACTAAVQVRTFGIPRLLMLTLRSLHRKLVSDLEAGQQQLAGGPPAVASNAKPPVSERKLVSCREPPSVSGDSGGDQAAQIPSTTSATPSLHAHTTVVLQSPAASSLAQRRGSVLSTDTSVPEQLSPFENQAPSGWVTDAETPQGAISPPPHSPVSAGLPKPGSAGPASTSSTGNLDPVSEDSETCVTPRAGETSTADSGVDSSPSSRWSNQPSSPNLFKRSSSGRLQSPGSAGSPSSSRRLSNPGSSSLSSPGSQLMSPTVRMPRHRLGSMPSISESRDGSIAPPGQGSSPGGSSGPPLLYRHSRSHSNASVASMDMSIIMGGGDSMSDWDADTGVRLPGYFDDDGSAASTPGHRRARSESSSGQEKHFLNGANVPGQSGQFNGINNHMPRHLRSNSDVGPSPLGDVRAFDLSAVPLSSLSAMPSSEEAVTQPSTPIARQGTRAGPQQDWRSPSTNRRGGLNLRLPALRPPPPVAGSATDVGNRVQDARPDQSANGEPESLAEGQQPADAAAPSGSADIVDEDGLVMAPQGARAGDTPAVNANSASDAVLLPLTDAAVRALSPRASGDSSYSSCGVCLDAKAETAITSCGHSLCLTCARGLCEQLVCSAVLCPFCRVLVGGFRLADGMAP